MEPLIMAHRHEYDSDCKWDFGCSCDAERPALIGEADHQPSLYWGDLGDYWYAKHLAGVLSEVR